MKVRVNVSDISRQLGGNYFSQKRVFVRGGGHPLFSRLLHFAIPFIQKAGKYLLKRGVDAAETGVAHYSQGNNIKDSLKAGAKRAYEKTRKDLDKVIGGVPRKTRKVGGAPKRLQYRTVFK
jgi:hypothetical protein